MYVSTFARVSRLVLIGALASAALAANQPEKSSTAAQFKTMDANGDGRVSREEHAAGAKKMFEAMDANSDGKVSPAEMDAAHEKITGRKATRADMSSAEKIKVIDTNGDGILTAEEHAAGSKTMFDKMDSNKNGYLSQSEFAAGHAKMLRKGVR